ncbi:PREDICTED: uncharacterized protein LOC107072448 [Polistes dominula]|uniref:Uncharacterized protein LOC107072448 n=1 Tax=Polistes dominula TaxID=743375 RepID=A0ABM1J5Z0_POLDO|nr:PREDICTED: uncharacterized protein LOC107072448 [Polistes dominula]
MAVTSDALHNTMMASFVSSSVYHGYVPLLPKENMLSCKNECNNNISVPSTTSNHNSSAMETDEGYDYSAASCRLNNDYVIPEASSRRLHEVENKQQSYCLFTTDQQQAVYGADAVRSRNRKRFYNNSGSAIEIKRFCSGSCVNNGTGSAKKDYGLTMMHSESTSLNLNSINDKTLDHSSVITESCCGAAGNHSLIYNPDYRQLSSSNGTESSDSSVELGELLFETHGCTMYHHYRQQQLVKHDIETEF